MTDRPVRRQPKALRRYAGWLGLILATPFFVWLVAGLAPGVPSMVEVLGATGVRYPAAVAVFGLLMGFIGFYED